MNKYCKKKFLSEFSLENIKQKTILKNDKKKILKLFADNLSQKNTNKSIEFAIELHISGFFDNLLSKLTVYYFNEVNLAQPKAILYLNSFLKYYYEKYPYSIKKNHPLIIVNDIKIRNFISFFITLLCGSSSRKILKLIKIEKDDFNLKKKKKKLISKDLNNVLKFVHNNDPKNIIIPMSEIINLLLNNSIVDREYQIIYWLSWLFEYEKTYHGKNLLVQYRDVKGVDIKYCKDFIWIIWSMLKYTSPLQYKKFISNLENIYKQKYTRGSKRSRVNILLLALLLIVNPTPKIPKKIPNISPELFRRCQVASLKSNILYLMFFQKIVLKNS